MTAAVAAALVNFLWQGILIGLLAAVGFSLSRSPRVRYLVGIGALALMAASPVLTTIFVARAGAFEAPPSIAHSSLPAQVPGSDSEGIVPGRGTENRSELWAAESWWREAIARASAAINQNATPLLTIWLVGVATLSMRLAWGWAGARRLTRRVADAADSIKAVGDQLIARLDIRIRVRIVESTLVKVPAVIGALKPVVLLPAAAMTGLAMEQIEALLAHELAHVRRHDYFVNLLQSAVETLLFYHPAVWLVSRRVRQERELCCDDIALSVCGDRVAYASALADLEARRVLPTPAMAATGGSLLSRVRRILGHDDVSALAGRSPSIAGVAILASMLLLVASQAAGARALPAGLEIVEAECCGAHPALFSPQSLIPPPPPDQAVQAGVLGGAVGGVGGGTAQGVAGGVPAGIVQGANEGIVAGVPSDVVGLVADAPPAQGAERILQPGDSVRVNVWSPVPQLEFSDRIYRLDGEGMILLPHLEKAVKVGGLTPSQARNEIRAALVSSQQYTSPVVDVVLVRASDNAVQTALERAVIGPFRAGDHIRIDIGEEIDPNSIRLFTTVSANAAIATAGFPAQTAALAALDGLKVAGETSATIIPEISRRLRSAGLTVPKLLVTFDDRNSNNASRFARREGAAQSAEKMTERPKSISVTVQGAVRRPGVLQLQPDRLALLDAIGAAGGLTAGAGSQIVVKRAGASDLIYSKAALMRNEVFDDKVQDGDTIIVEIAPHFYVTGYVKDPQSEYNWTPGMTLQQAIALAGGVTELGALNRIAIQRKDPQTGTFKRVKLDKDKMSTPIKPSDVISVPKKRL